MLFRYLLFILIFFICTKSTFCQIGGDRLFEVTNLPGSARLNGIGGVNVSLDRGDVTSFLSNPALLQNDVTDIVSLNYVNFVSDIKYTNLAYAHDIKGKAFAFGLQFMGYGDFEAYDETGESIGEFSANDYVVTIGHSHQVGNFALGVNMKWASSKIDIYKAGALMWDLGGVFRHPNKDLSIGMNFKNVGFLVNQFTEASTTTLPFDFQTGISFKPEHMPFRFSFTAYNLYQADITYFDPNNPANLVEEDEPGRVDKIFRHITVGTELILSENFNLRGGYNHLMRRELRLEDISGGAGITLGFMLRIKKFEFAFSRNIYHVAGGASTFGIVYNIDKLYQKGVVEKGI